MLDQEEIDFNMWYSPCRQLFPSDDGCKEILNNLITSLCDNNFDNLLPDIDRTLRVTDCRASTKDNDSFLMKSAGDFEQTLCNHATHLKCINFSNPKYFLKWLPSDCKRTSLSIDRLNEAMDKLQENT